MSASLLENFALLAASEGGVAKLRELILSLAVRGKLVPQDPADEPASELLKRIRAEKERLITERKIRRGKLTRTLRARLTDARTLQARLASALVDEVAA